MKCCSKAFQISYCVQMTPDYTMTSRQGNISALLALYEGNPQVTEKASNQELDIFFNVNLNELLNKQSSCRWFAMPWRPCDVIGMRRTRNA